MGSEPPGASEPAPARLSPSLPGQHRPGRAAAGGRGWGWGCCCAAPLPSGCSSPRSAASDEEGGQGEEAGSYRAEGGKKGGKEASTGPAGQPPPPGPCAAAGGCGQVREGPGCASPRLTAPRFSPHSTPVLWCTPLLLSASRPSSAPRFSCQHSSSLVHHGSPLSILVLLVHPTSPVSTPVLLLHPAFLVHFGSPGAPQFT